MATDLERLNLVVQNKENLRNAFIEIGEDVDETTPFSEYAIIVRGLPGKGVMNEIRDAINNKGGNLLSDTPVSEYPAAINALGAGGEDYLKKLLTATNNSSYLFRNYTGTSVDELIKPSHTSSVTDMSYMFQYCRNLTTIPLLDTGNVTLMVSMFSECNNLESIPLLNTSNATSMSYMFHACSYKMTTIPLLSTSNVTNMSYMFYQARKLDTIPLLDTSNVTTMSYMFSQCDSLTSIPQLNTSKVTYMTQMFNGCAKLTTIPLLDTSNVTSMEKMFYGCLTLSSFPLLNTDKVSNMSNMFYNCRLLPSIEFINTSLVTNMSYMFYGCNALLTIYNLDMGSITNAGNVNRVFYDCSNLTNLTVKNIRVNLQLAANSYGNLLTLDSLVNTCKECINAGSSRTLTIGSTNLNKLSDIYVKFTDSSVTSIPSNEKGTVEVCNSTDAGAMTISAYMQLKNWSLA